MTPYEQAKDMFMGKNVLIFGLGLLGGAAGDARFFCKLGANVRATDQKTADQLQSTLGSLADYSITYSLGGHQEADINWADYIVRNPSVPFDHPLLNQARNLQKRIIMRSSLFVELANIFTIGITGTRGKTTTTALIYELANRCTGKNVLLGGNIAGVSDLELLEKITDPANTIAVMELSSWQLQGFAESKISPNLAVVTNLYPDHLNKYPNLEAYYQDKQTIMLYQHENDTVILNHDIPELETWATKAKGKIEWYSGNDLSPTITLEIPGNHNRSNAAAVLKVAEVLGYPTPTALEIIASFKGVPFRLQTIAKKSDITYINDTTSTTPVATIAALQSVDYPILICGGADKNLPIDEMIAVVNQRAKAVVLLPGNGTDRIKPHLNPDLLIGVVNSMAEAVTKATSSAVPGDAVLLSPGFASFGLFNNEFDRGNQFNQCVQTHY